MLTDGLAKIAKDRGVNLAISGEPALFYLVIRDDDSLLLHQEWIAECVKRGVFLTNHHNHFVNLSLTPELVNETRKSATKQPKIMVKTTPKFIANIII